MRNMFLLMPLLIAASPACAQYAPTPLPPALTDPSTADRVADSMQVISNAFLDLKVGELKATIDGHRATAAEKRMTIRDLGRRDDPNFDREIGQSIANVKPVIRQSQRAINDSLPGLIESVEQVRRSIDRIAANLPDPTYPRR